jgi:hypothetical protein
MPMHDSCGSQEAQLLQEAQLSQEALLSRGLMFELQVIETASGLTPEDEAAFMRQRASAASSTVPEAFLREVSVHIEPRTLAANTCCIKPKSCLSASL